MRIAIVHENWGAGAARCARDLEMALRLRHDVLYFPRSDKPETADSVLRGLASFKPDVVNCHSFYGGLPYDTLVEISNLYPVCFTVHDPRPIGTMAPVCYSCDRNALCLRCPMVPGRWSKLFRNRFARERLSKRLCHRRCGEDMHIVVPSQWLANRLRNQELGRFQITVVRNGIDLDRFRPRTSERAKFGLPDNVPVILYLAWHLGWRINEGKGMRFLAEAFRDQVVKHFDSAILAVAGESFAPNHPNVRPLGMISNEQLPELLSSVDIFVTPTLADNFPYTVSEAMSCGKAVLASGVGGIPEQVIDGETGRLVPPGDPDSLGAALVEMLSDSDQLARYGKGGRMKAEDELGMDAFVAAYETIFESLKRD